MNFHVYLDDDLGKKINKVCHETHKKRNTIIREALRQYLEQRQDQEWPPEILAYKGVKDFPRFESYRDEFPKENSRTFLEDM